MGLESLSSSLQLLGLIPTKFKKPTTFKFLNSLKFSPSNRFFCNFSHHQQQPEVVKKEMTKYKESFSRRMSMAGLKPHHRITMGVSGGPDSVALCVLAAEWKIDAGFGIHDANGCIHGLLAVIVDHNLRPESSEEANTVSHRISKMGIRCEIARCDWSDGRPTQGHLQEMARDMRYQIFQNVCIENQIGILLIAHHADDQAELFILRLSRNSGVLGLAGMAFTSPLFPSHMHYCGENSCTHGILLVRPLLEFSKEDLYEICRGGKQEWVEDPTNQKSLFARNRIRMSLRDLSSSFIKSELQAIISACRKTRSFVDKFCCDLIEKAVTVTTYGYAIVDLEKLDPLNVDDLCLSKFATLVLQFISQRHRQVRGRTSKLLLDYMRKLPCKTSLTAAGCYLCAAPQSKGTKILVCCSPHSPHPSEVESSHSYTCEGKKNCSPSVIQQIIMDGKSYSDSLVPDASDVPFLHTRSSDCILSEGKRLHMISESTYNSITLLQKGENENFRTKRGSMYGNELRHESPSGTTFDEPLQSGQFYHFMKRFLVTWRCYKSIRKNSDGNLCESCVLGHETEASVRPMIDMDWLYLASLLRGQSSGGCEEHIDHEVDKKSEQTLTCPEYVRMSAQRALQALKYIPVAARRSLPVLVNSQGLLLSIPSVSFEHCPCLLTSVVFKPRVPLGGGHSSFL